jgi:hypothetical protein
MADNSIIIDVKWPVPGDSTMITGYIVYYLEGHTKLYSPSSPIMAPTRISTPAPGVSSISLKSAPPTTLAPTGEPMMVVRDSQYLTNDEFLDYLNGLKLTTSSMLYASGVLDILLQSASEEVNRCNRRNFDT